MSEIRLRAVIESDLGPLTGMHSLENDQWSFFGITPAGELERGFAANGLLPRDHEHGTLAVTDAEGTLLGSVGWHPVRYGPGSTSQVLNIGITLLPEHRGRGYGTAAQRALAGYLFSVTRLERIEATTDVENTAEQRSLEKAGFTREGVLRHAQYRSGGWHDMVIYSRLRGDQ
jgi:RimJ/RimL family protein N-acetyltransferase